MITCNRCKTGANESFMTSFDDERGDGRTKRHLCVGCMQDFESWLREPPLRQADFRGLATRIVEAVQAAAAVTEDDSAPPAEQAS